MQRTTTFKRMMSAFLAIILLLGLTPSIPLPAFAAENGMPDTISYIKTEFGINGDVGLTAESNGAKYHSSHLGGTVYVQDFQMKADGETVHGFCFDHTKHLDNKEPYVSDTLPHRNQHRPGNRRNHHRGSPLSSQVPTARVLSTARPT